MTLDATLPADVDQPLAALGRSAATEDVTTRMWRRDATLWAPEGTPEVANRLGWLTIADAMLDEAGALEAFARECAQEGLTDAVLLGMGGSSLAPEVFRLTYGDREGALRLHVLDSTEPLAIRAVHDRIDPAATLFIVSTKSGGTVETLSLFAYFHAVQPDGRHFVAITDPGSSLLGLAEEHGFRRVFVNDPDIGGRYSALSHFGMVPAALAGVDITRVLEAAVAGEKACADHTPENPGLQLGLALGELARNGRDKLTFVVSPAISSFGVWAEQLVAESTGKHGTGILPVADEPVAPPGDYGPDRVFLRLRTTDAPDAELDAAVAALAAAGHPTLSLPVGDRDDLGRVFFLSEFATAVVGWVLAINPFDQPNVQEAKDNTKRVLDEGAPPLPEAGDEELGRLLGALAPPHYLAIMGYLPPSAEVDAAIARLRRAVLGARHVATTYGYGPRFLHSTGQFHKGGPPTGVFLQLVHDATDDLEIPGAAFSFRTLIDAQADGDLQTLRSHGLPAERVRLPAGDLAGGIDKLTATLEGLL